MRFKAPPAIVIGALAGAPAQAHDGEATRVRVLVEAVWRPGSLKPPGVALTGDVSHFPGRRWQAAPSPSVGAGARVEVFLDKEVRLALEPTVGIGVGELNNRCSIGYQGGSGHFEVRPGLIYSLRTGAHAWLGASAEGTWLPFVARARGGATVSFRRHRHPNALKSSFREVFANVSGGLGLADTFDCTEWSVGRPLRSEGVAVLPAYDASGPITATAREWLDQAKEEHAAAAAFIKLAAELAALGAPAELVRRSLASAAEEVAHAQLCLDRACALSKVQVTLHPLRTTSRESLPRGVLLSLLRAEALVDGVLNEGLAAFDAADRAATSGDAVGAAIHRRIAREELGHAVLAATIARWCGRALQV